MARRYDLRAERVQGGRKTAANLDTKVQLGELVGTAAPHHKVLICSYEALYAHGRALCTGAGVDLLVALNTKIKNKKY